MKQIILLATYLPASKQTLAQFIALAGRTWLTNRMCEHSNKNHLLPALFYMRMRVYQIIPKWATKDGVEKKEPILYRNNELYEIAKRAREPWMICMTAEAPAISSRTSKVERAAKAFPEKAILMAAAVARILLIFLLLNLYFFQVNTSSQKGISISVTSPIWISSFFFIYVGIRTTLPFR